MNSSIKRIALVADLHGNLPAVQALEKDLERRDIREIYCLGDVVGKGPSSAETFDWAFSHCQVLLQGNWDSGIGYMQFPNDRFYYGQLGPKRMKKLREMPQEYSFTLSGRKIRLLHGRPVMRELLSPTSASEKLEWLFDPNYQVVGYADIHRQALRMIGTRGILFNTGAVGNGLGVPMVQYTILTGSESDTNAPFDISFVTFPYDREAAVADAEKVQKDLPKWDLYCKEIRTARYSRMNTGKND